MTNKDKQKLLKYLQPANNFRKLLSKDLYKELSKFVPNNLIINPINIDDTIRERNRKHFINVIHKYFHLYNYEEFIQIFYPYNYEDFLIRIFIDYVLYYVNSNKAYKYVEIFEDELCICYQLVLF